MKNIKITGLIIFILSLIVIVYYLLSNFFYGSDTLSSSSNSIDDNFVVFDESDFDLFVYRVHVLSSESNAESIKIQIVDGGLPAFIEKFEDNDKLFSVYVGPFLSKEYIVNNIDLIQQLSETNDGEILRWKL